MRARALLAAAGMLLAGAATAQDTRPASEQTAEQPAEQPAAQPAPAPRASAVPSRETIRAAVRGLQADTPANPRLHEADTLRANAYETFARKVDEAVVPDCLHADGLKRQPTFFIGGWLALPFVAVAKLRGVCQ